MTRSVLMPLQRTWLLVVGATRVALWMREDRLAGFTIGAMTLAIAYAKARLVIWILWSCATRRCSGDVCWRAGCCWSAA